MIAKTRIAAALTSIVTVCAVMMILAGSASAAWRQVSERSGSNTDVIGSVRGTDGTLHLIYRDVESASLTGLRYRTISPSGVLGAPMTVQTGWTGGVNNPDLEFVGGTLTAFWGGVSGTSPDPLTSGKAWSAAFDGATFNRAAEAMTVASNPYASGEISSAVATDGTPIISWQQTGWLGIHAGLASTGAENNLSTGCCQYATNLATDPATGSVYVAYTSNQTDANGAYLQMVYPTVGAATRVSTTPITEFLGRSKRIAAVPRTTGGGVYTAFCDTYPDCTRIRIAGSNGVTRTYRPRIDANAEEVWLAAGPDGRMWLAIADNGERLDVIRSNKAMTRWSAPQRVAFPRGIESAWYLAGDGARGPLDLLANVTVGASTFAYHNRIKPLLALAPSPSRVRNNRARRVTFTVTDAGDRMAGARVVFRGRRVTTNSRGQASFTVPAGTSARTYSASATMTGYVSAGARVRVTS